MLRVTYSKNAFFPLTRVCRNECTYCNFRRNEASIMSLDEVRRLAEAACRCGCREALLTFGERPEIYRDFRKILKSKGYSSFVDYVCNACEVCIECGLIPHTNAGVLYTDEMKKLKPLNGSMGLMLEQAVELDCHANSPGKNPEVRVKVLERAGKLGIPFTTGILLGIGESRYDRFYSLEVIAEVNENYGHIQEVIVQPLVLGRKRRVELKEVKEVVVEAKKLFKHVQIPPNLFSPGEVVSLVKSGANDLGGISPITPDHVNPGNPWPSLSELESFLRKEGIEMKERLPVYDEFIERGMYGEKTAELIRRWFSC